MRGSSALVVLVVAALVAPAGAQSWKGRARLDGRVTDADGVPMLGATVALERLSGEKGPRVVSDAQGLWTVDGIASGSWMVAVEAPGYGVERIGVHLPSESSWLAPLEVRLAPDRPGPPPENPEAEVPGERTRTAGAEGVPSATPAGVRAALAAGRVDHARELASGLDRSDPAAGTVLVEVGAALLAAGETSDAVTCLDEALGHDPNHVEARYRRALGLLALGREAEARRDFEEVVASGPDDALAARARLALDELPRPGE